MKTGAQLIADERERQISQEGWTPSGDDKYINGELRDAAIAYAMICDDRAGETAHDIFPWEPEWFKIGEDGVDAIRCLTKAGALIAAEIDRLQRKGSPNGLGAADAQLQALSREQGSRQLSDGSNSNPT